MPRNLVDPPHAHPTHKTNHHLLSLGVPPRKPSPFFSLILGITHVCMHVHIDQYRLIRGSETAPALATHLCITHVCMHVHIAQYRLIRRSETAPALATHLCITHVYMHVYIALYKLIRGSWTSPAGWHPGEMLVNFWIFGLSRSLKLSQVVHHLHMQYLRPAGTPGKCCFFLSLCLLQQKSGACLSRHIWCSLCRLPFLDQFSHYRPAGTPGKCCPFFSGSCFLQQQAHFLD